MKKLLIILTAFFLLMHPASALIVNKGTQIQPSGGTGFYTLDNDVYANELDVNSTHLIFSGLDSKNQTVTILNTGQVLCTSVSTCTIPSTNSILTLSFSFLPIFIPVVPVAPITPLFPSANFTTPA